MHAFFPDAASLAIRRLYELMSPCRICPRQCGARRDQGERGFCGAGRQIELAAANVHCGEEPPISGERGSGTLFFSHCSLRCLYCQNWPISQRGVGAPVTVDELADRMLRLQQRGVHNINLVNPTHYWPLIAEAVALARGRGLAIPVLANTSGYENVEVLRLLDDTVQIWLPDLKYVSADWSHHASGARNLPAVSWRAVGFLVRRHGLLRTSSDGLAVGGVLIRHLVLPTAVSQTRAVLQRVRRRFGRRVALSLMTQYFPAYKAHQDPRLHRALRAAEKRRAWRFSRRFRIRRGWRQNDE